MIGAKLSSRRKGLDAVGEFDPFLGPGSRIGAVMEDLDLLYRVFREKFKIVYSPDALVYHNHGRTTDAQIQALNHRYVVGRGAFYCKHILGGDRNVLKMAYWEFSSLAKGMIKDLFAGKKIQEQGRLLWALLVGAGGRLAWNSRIRRCECCGLKGGTEGKGLRDRMNAANPGVVRAANAADQPLLNDVGILALVPDQWSARWMVRHHIMARLGRYFRVVWVNPAQHWRDTFKVASVPLRPLDADQYPGFMEYTAHPCLPDFYHPLPLPQFMMRQRLLRASPMLQDRGCRKIILCF